MSVVNIGIIGVGGFGRFSLEQFQRMPGVRVTAIAGTNPAKYAALAEEFDIPFHTTNWQALVAHPAVNIVYIATPPDTRVEMVTAALTAGKHVFSEKPLALALPAADRMLETAARNERRLGINFIMRYNPLYDAARAVVSAGVFGAPQRFFFENNASDLPAEHWFWDPARSGGILVEHGVHFFDIFHSFFGPGRLQWAGMGRRESGEADRWFCMLRYNERMFGSFYHAFDKPSEIEHTRAVIECEQGTLTFDGWYPISLTVEGITDAGGVEAMRASFSDLSVAAFAQPASVSAGGVCRQVTHRVNAGLALDDTQTAYAGAISAAMRDFIAWTQDPTHTPRVSGADGRAALALALAATGKAVENAK